MKPSETRQLTEELRGLLGGRSPSRCLPVVQEAKATGPLPKSWGVTYAHPNPDGSRKNCLNCRQWVQPLDQCTLFDPKLTIVGDAVCGYHATGTPRQKRGESAGAPYLDPTTSGLDKVPGGTACDNCRYFGAESRDSIEGECNAVATSAGNRASVEARGCCSRWESMSS